LCEGKSKEKKEFLLNLRDAHRVKEGAQTIIYAFVSSSLEIERRMEDKIRPVRGIIDDGSSWIQIIMLLYKL
jgi:hypothetical protein